MARDGRADLRKYDREPARKDECKNIHSHTKTDILLIQPPIRDFYLTAKRTLPAGLVALAGPLRRAGFRVDILDAPGSGKVRHRPLPDEMSFLPEFYPFPDQSPFALFHGFRHYGMSFDHIGRLAAASGAFLVGIAGLFTAYAEEALETARSVRRHLPHVRIIMGGHHPTALPASVLAEPAVDFVLRGEGDESFPDLARRLFDHPDVSNRDLEDVPGIAFRRSGGGLFIRPPAIVEDLDRLPPPDWSGVKMKPYRRKGRGSRVITTSRGCPMRCAYCCVTADTVPWRRRSVSAVLDEMEQAWYEDGVRFFDFEDENLSMNRAWFTEFLDGLITRLGPAPDPDSNPHTRNPQTRELRAMNGLFAPSLDRDLIRKMKTAGFTALNLSLGTFDPDTLNRFHRPDASRAVTDAVAHAAEAGMESVVYLIVGAPDQDPMRSLEDLLKLAPLPCLVGVSVYYPAPGSRMWTECEERDLLPDRFSLLRSACLPLDHATSRLQTATLLRLGRIVNFLKLLRARNIPAPRHATQTTPLPPGAVLDPRDRIESGRKLLSAFYHDGILRGLTPQGEIRRHTTDPQLTSAFISRMLESGP